MWQTVGRIAVVTLVWCGLAAAATFTGLPSSTVEVVAGLGAGLTFFAWARALSQLRRRIRLNAKDELPVEVDERRATP